MLPEIVAEARELAPQSVLGLERPPVPPAVHLTATQNRFRHELAVQDFGAKNIYGGDLYRGFIYFQCQPYTVLRVKVTNVSERKSEVVEIPVQ